MLKPASIPGLKPASIPGLKPASTLLADLYGDLALHPWRDPVVASADAYSLFYSRSSAMGWLTRAAENASGGVWGMNDAGQDLPGSGPQPCRVAWFQVSLTQPIPADRSLPVQAFLACAGEVVARIGTLRLQAVQILLPVESLDGSQGAWSPASAVMTLLKDAGWFSDGDPDLRTPVRVTLDSGQDPSIPLAAPEMLRWMRDIKQDVFSCDSLSTTDDDGLLLKPGIIDELWRGPACHRATFRGTLTEWSLDALGWLAALLACASAQHGINTPLLFTASRFERW